MLLNGIAIDPSLRYPQVSSRKEIRPCSEDVPATQNLNYPISIPM
jgi:hypothetical protein